MRIPGDERPDRWAIVSPQGSPNLTANEIVIAMRRRQPGRESKGWRHGQRGHTPSRGLSEVDAPMAGNLAAKFKPYVLFDSREPWRPLNVTEFLNEGTHKFCTRRPTDVTCVPIQNANEFATLAANARALGPSTYLDIAGNRVPDYHGPDRCPGRLLDCGAAPRSAIYYHVTQSNDRFYVDYSWFLRFNHFAASEPTFSCKTQVARQSGVCDEHEGDSEGITVVTPPDNREHIAYVVYAAHKGTFRYTATQLHMHPKGSTHPVVYLANGSHAAYPQPCLSEHCSGSKRVGTAGVRRDHPRTTERDHCCVGGVRRLVRLGLLYGLSHYYPATAADGIAGFARKRSCGSYRALTACSRSKVSG